MAWLLTHASESQRMDTVKQKRIAHIPMIYPQLGILALPYLQEREYRLFMDVFEMSICS
ncbi:hypothetical protein [Legionella oakridgensis]|uniref:hypothetical protein n=1 Tax=Legionella oakridgensis TaxID=29423 RepID=UPI0003DE483A|nr:hypothetical protein [Legionella oakridgensis]ETO94509.1 hypothetical protein LOR_53c11490 [Legionella oakridgensis RV-2-2007]